MKSKILVSIEVECDRDTDQKTRHELIEDAIEWASIKIRKIHRAGESEAAILGGEPATGWTWKFMVTQFNEMDTYKPQVQPEGVKPK